MIYVKIDGGLGNQMFQYALALSLKEFGLDIKIDLASFKKNVLHNGFELNKIFHISIPVAEHEEVKHLKDDNTSYLHKVKRKIVGRKKSHITENNFNLESLNLNDNFYLDGYWQSENFFDVGRKKVIETYQFPKIYDSRNEDIISKIKNSNSVSIHVRRGDYINNSKIYKEYGAICGKEYYDNAISKLKSHIKNPTFFVFTNDSEWAKKNLSISNQSHLIDWNKKENSFKDMYLMTLCKHNIIPNSSFSWWGAWLNKNKNKTVIAPNIWKISEGSNNWRTPKDWFRI